MPRAPSPTCMPYGLAYPTTLTYLHGRYCGCMAMAVPLTSLPLHGRGCACSKHAVRGPTTATATTGVEGGVATAWWHSHLTHAAACCRCRRPRWCQLTRRAWGTRCWGCPCTARSAAMQRRWPCCRCGGGGGGGFELPSLREVGVRTFICASSSIVLLTCLGLCEGEGLGAPNPNPNCLTPTLSDAPPS